MKVRKVGLPPGTLLPAEEKKAEKRRITIIEYDETRYQEKDAKMVEDRFPFKDKPTTTWINIDGVHDVEVVERIGECFRLDPLTLEDVAGTEQRPKIEEFEDCVFVVLKMLSVKGTDDEIQTEQVSLILTSNLVTSFQERKGDVFDPIREGIRQGKGRIRKMGADYLASALIDTLVDNYFLIPEALGERMESLHEKVIMEPTPETLQAIHHTHLSKGTH